MQDNGMPITHTECISQIVADVEVEVAGSHSSQVPARLLYDSATPEEIIAHYSLEVTLWATNPYHEAFLQMPLNDWLHLRFCAVYPVHRWVHRSFVRVLLYNSFCSETRLPGKVHIKAAVDLANRFSRRLPDTVLKVLGDFVVFMETLSSFTDNSPFDLRNWSREDRAISALFIDAERMPTTNLPESIRELLFKPLRWFHLAPDILALPLHVSQRSNNPLSRRALQVPTLLTSTCVCGDCQLIQSQLSSSLGNFREDYFSMIEDAALRNCESLEIAWEPVLERAEDWLDDLVGRIESPCPLFSWRSTRRPGPYILQIAENSGIELGSQPTVTSLLLLAMALHMYDTALPPANFIFRPALVLGFSVRNVNAPASPRNVLVVRGGWLYDLASPYDDEEQGCVTFLYPSDRLSICNHSDGEDGDVSWDIISMPILKNDTSDRLPYMHDPSTVREVPAPEPRRRCVGSTSTSMIASRRAEDGFPTSSLIRRLSLLLRITIWDRIIETVYRPAVTMGSTCDHKDGCGRMTRCAPTAADILALVQPPEQALLDQTRFPDSDRCLLRRYEALLHNVGQRGSYFDRDRVCIVRCGDLDGPPEPVVVLAGKFGKKVYIIHRRECWECALSRMREYRCTVGIALDTKNTTTCERCNHEREQLSRTSFPFSDVYLS